MAGYVGPRWTDLEVENARIIWTLTSDEDAFIERVPFDQRHIFRQFIVGYKMYCIDEGIDLLDWNIVQYVWETADIDEESAQWKEDYLGRAKDAKNPYIQFLEGLDPEEFDTLRSDKTYGLYRLGFMLYDLRYYDDDYTTKLYEASDIIHILIKFAQLRLEDRDSVAPSVSGMDYLHMDHDLPKPTLIDRKELCKVVGTLCLGNWLFEKTIFHQSAPDTGFARTVYLYCLIDNNRNLRERIVSKVQAYRTELEAIRNMEQEFGTHRALSAVQQDWILYCYAHSIRRRTFLEHIDDDKSLWAGDVKLKDHEEEDEYFHSPGGGERYADEDSSDIFYDAIHGKEDKYKKALSKKVARYVGYGWLEYAPYGDISDTLKAMRRQRKGQIIPEFYIWLVFRNLTRSLFNLEMGKSTHGVVLSPEDLETDHAAFRKKFKSPDWRSVINTDMKTRNVMWAPPQNPFPGVPQPKMMDFGYTYRHNTNPDLYYSFVEGDDTLGGTTGWYAPEVLFHADVNAMEYLPGNEYDFDIGVHTMIFSIGLIILSMMNNENRHYDPREENSPNHKADYTFPYSKDLEILVMDCLEIDWMKRPTLAQLMYKTTKGFNETTVSSPAKDPTNKLYGQLPPNFQLPYPWEELQVGDFTDSGEEENKKRKSSEDLGATEGRLRLAKKAKSA